MTENTSDETTPAENEAPQYGPGQGPGARSLSEAEVSTILEGQRFGVLATLKQSGQPHLASMVVTWDPEERIARFSSAEGRIKVKHLLRNPVATLHVQGESVFSYAVAEGEAEVSEAAFLEQMVKDRRVLIKLRVSRAYGTALDA